jgi:hypothetical protein
MVLDHHCHDFKPPLTPLALISMVKNGEYTHIYVYSTIPLVFTIVH